MKERLRAAADVNRLKLKDLKARKIIAQGKRGDVSAALVNQSNTNQALQGDR